MLLINGSTRSEHTCPGEISKTRRLAHAARDVIASPRGFEVDFLDLCTLADEPAQVIHPCKACVSTAHAALPLAMLLLPEPRARPDERLDGRDLSALGRRARRDDRLPGALVPGAGEPEADDRSPRLRRRRQSRPTTTHGKDPAAAKAIELAGWAYPKHLAGPRLRRRRARRRRGPRELCAACSPTGSPTWASIQAGAAARARHAHRLLRAVRDEPRGARRRSGCVRRGA